MLGLTTNPLVALYFACEEYGDVYYKGIEDEEDVKIQEANGVIFFNRKYSVSTNEINIKIISSLSQIDLSNDNTLESILRKLTERQAISKELEERWKSKEQFEEFINIIQNNYIVIPPYNNERLSRQCGMFLLAGCFNFVYTESISESSIEKGYKDLREEFDRKFFYIPGEKKKTILEELDTYNINEATLFPELEHQLSYIKKKKNAKSKASSEFIKFDFNDIGGSKEEQSIVKAGAFKSMPIGKDYNNGLNWTISAEGFMGNGETKRKFLVVDEIFSAKANYHIYGIGMKNEIGKNFRISEDFSLRPYAALKLEYGRTSKIKEKNGEVRLEIKENDYFSVKPEIGAELAFKHYFGMKALKTTLGVTYENELGKVANVENKARVAYTSAGWYDLRGEKEDRRGNVKFDLNVGVDNTRVGVTANVGYDMKGQNLRGGLGLRIIF